MLPTPVEHAAQLGARLGVPQLYVKRDDLISPAYGGSKVRKLEYFLGAAAAAERTELVTGGSLGSHHALATAIHGARNGFGVELLLLPEPDSQEMREVLAASTAHARSIRRVPTARALSRTWQRSMAELGDRGFSIPLGGSSPLGAIGTVEAALELEEQVIRGELPPPDLIYVALGTMSTAVGLALGLQLTALPTKVVAVRASNPSTSTLAHCEKLFQETVTLLNSAEPRFPRLTFEPDRFKIGARHLGGGYALPTREGRTMKTLAREHGNLSLELTYTAKAMAALAGDARAIGTRPALFWHTHAGPPPTP